MPWITSMDISGPVWMSILINKDTRILVQGITGREGEFHARQMQSYAKNVVAGVTPGKGGLWVLDGEVPVFNCVSEAIQQTGANASVIFVPARSAKDAIIEAVNVGMPLIVCITEGIPVWDMMEVRSKVLSRGSMLIGPNCPGIISPGEAKAGIIPGEITQPGPVGIVSRSGTLTYELLNDLKAWETGVSTCVGIGGDPVHGLDFIEILEMFEADEQTKCIVLLGEIGGNSEEKAAEFIHSHISKPVVAFIAGRSAPPEIRMGHAGAIIAGTSGRAQTKIDALTRAGINVALTPMEIPGVILNLLID